MVVERHRLRRGLKKLERDQGGRGSRGGPCAAVQARAPLDHRAERSAVQRRLSPEPILISSTLPSAAPVTRLRIGACSFCRIARCNRCGALGAKIEETGVRHRHSARHGRSLRPTRGLVERRQSWRRGRLRHRCVASRCVQDRAEAAVARFPEWHPKHRFGGRKDERP
jgi:hypothetical protein